MNKRFINITIFIGVLCVYILDNLPYLNINKNTMYIYVAKPVIWLLFFVIILFLPKAKYKTKAKYKQLLRGWVLYLAAFYMALRAFGGLIHGFGKSPYNLSFLGIIQNLFLFISVLIGREVARGYLVNNRRKKDININLVVITFLFSLTSIPLSKVINIQNSLDLIRFIGEEVLPQISLNIFATYLVLLGGPVLSIIYIGITQGIQYISPILGDLKWITSAIIGILAPIFSFMFLQYAYLKESKEIKIRNFKKEKPLGWIITSFISVMIIWFFVGVFPLYPSVIVTGSMMPMIKPGDMVIVKKVKSSEVKLGEVIQYRQDDIYIFHRVVDIMEEKGEVAYQAKGDNNSVPDADLVSPAMIKGKVIKVIPKIGWPTLLLRDKRNDVDREKVEF